MFQFRGEDNAFLRRLCRRRQRQIIRAEDHIIFADSSIRLENGETAAGQLDLFELFETCEERHGLVALPRPLVLGGQSIRPGNESRIEIDDLFQHLDPLIVPAEIDKGLGAFVQHIRIIPVGFTHSLEMFESFVVFPEVLIIQPETELGMQMGGIGL